MDRIKELQIEIKNIVKKGGYIGELILPEEELLVLCKTIDNCPVDILVLCAVNCAYYYYDDNGFWCHFCELTGIDDKYKNESDIGRKIIDCMLSEGCKVIQQKREGPFRYVGPILEQTGITYKYLNKYADFLVHLSEKFGWDRLESIQEKIFREEVAKNIPEANRYLKKYLYNTGWKYTLDIVKQLHVNHFNKNELEKLSGYPPDLWNFILTKKQPILVSPVRIIPPFLSFNPERMVLQWNFDALQVSKGILQFENETVDSTSIPIGCDRNMPLKGYYEYGSNNTIAGWDVDKEPLVLFRVKHPYRMIRDLTNVSPGEYYVLITAEESEAFQADVNNKKCDVKHVLGPMNIFSENGEARVDISVIDFKEGTTFDRYGIKTANCEEFASLEWEGGEKLAGVMNAMDIFIQEIPQLRLKLAHLELSKIIIRKNIEEKEKELFLNGEYFKRDDTKIEYGEFARISVFPRGRIRDNNTWENTCKEYTLLPECRFNYEQKILSANEKHSIEFEGPDDVQIQWTEKLVQTCQNEQKRVWDIPASCRYISGKLKYRNLSLDIAFQVFRCIIEWDNNRGHKNILWKSELNTNIKLNIFICPNIDFTVGLSDFKTVETLKECSTEGKSFAALTLNDIKDAIKSTSFLCGQFVISKNVSPFEWKNSGSFYVDEEKLIGELQRTQISSSIDMLPPSFREVITAIKDIRDDVVKLHDKDIENLLAFEIDSKTFREWTAVHFAAHIIFDVENDVKINEMEKLLGHEWKVFFNWYRDAVDLIAPGTKAEAEKFKVALSQLPINTYRKFESFGIQRWSDKAKLVKEKLELFSNVENQLLEWTDMVRITNIGGWKGAIAEKTGGKEISRAWRYYMQGRYDEACRFAATLEVVNLVPHMDNTHKNLLYIVHKMALLRTGRTMALHYQYQSDERIWKTDIAIIDLICRIATGDAISCIKQDVLKINLLAKLPLNKWDMNLMTIISRGKFQNIRLSDDWLTNWIVFKLYPADGKQFLEKLSNQIKDISDSPLKTKIINRIK